MHAHIGSQIFELDAFAEELAALAPFVVANGFERVLRRGRPRRRLRRGGGGAHDHRVGACGALGRCGRPVCRRMSGSPPSPVGPSSPRPAVTLYRVGTIKRLPGLRTYVAVDGGMSDNPRPVLYGSGYEAFLPRAPHERRPAGGAGRGQALRVRRRLVDDARLPADLVVGDVLATPVTGAYGFAMASNYNRVLRPPVVFVSEGSSPRRRPARDHRRPARS